LCNFARGEQAIIEFRRRLRKAKHQRRFGNAFDVAGNQTMGGEIDDAVVGQRSALDRGFAGVLSEMNVGGCHAEVLCDRVEFVGGVRQLRQRLR